MGGHVAPGRMYRSHRVSPSSSPMSLMRPIPRVNVLNRLLTWVMNFSRAVARPAGLPGRAVKRCGARKPRSGCVTCSVATRSPWLVCSGHVGRVSGPEALLAGADLPGSVDRCGVDDPVSHLSGPGGVHDRFSDEIYLLVRAQNLELDLVHDVQDVSLAPPSAAHEAL